MGQLFKLVCFREPEMFPSNRELGMVAERSHRKNRSNSYIITKKSEKNYYLKKIN